jgi:pimeloyl-ACP methyl ester carboxylesterase
MKEYIYLLIFAGFVFTSSLVHAQEFIPKFKESRKTTHKISKDQDYTFGYLEVPENRQKANSKTIKLPVYIFKSRSEHPENDPIIYTVGGPGATTMPSAQYMKHYSYLDDRDFILIEQRGTYYAKPHLDCPEWAEAAHRSNLPGLESSEIDSLFENAACACRNRLVKQGIDLDGYNTNEIAADINDLVRALNIESYNLLTISYSTKIAQVLMRDYPDRIRSVVMDSPLPLESSFDEESVQNLFESMDKLFRDCELDTNCNQAFPDLKTRFYKYLVEKTKVPLEVQVKNPNNDRLETFYLTGKDFITVFTSGYTGDVVSIPYEINKLLNGDLTSVKEKLSALFGRPGNGAGMGMRLSVWCGEEHPFNSQEIIDEETTKYPEVIGLSPETFTEEVCTIWSVKKVADIENQAVQSDIPVLIISGEYDNITPAKWGEKMLENLPNGQQLIFSGWMHTPITYWNDSCAMQAVYDFFKSPNARSTPECFERILRPTFKTP